MRPATRPVNRKSRSVTATIPAPTRGLNARDPLALLKPTDALILDNILCRPSYLEVRKGRQNHVTGFANPVETLMPYVSVTSGKELWAIAGGSIFNATAAGAVGAAAVSGLTNSYWNHTQVSNVAGNFLICCNGVDSARIYDGTTWASSGFTGLALTSISNIGVWKRRVWCVEKNSFKVWYGAADAIAGALTALNVSGIFRRGGKIVATLNWTIDGGAGIDDHLLIVTSMGEVAIYKGTDPAVAGNFNCIGVYYVGAPVGERFYAQLGGDVLILTVDGLVPLTQYLQSQTVNRTTFLTDRIHELISTDVTTWGAVVGWEVHVFFAEGFIFLQVPAGGTGNYYQYVMNITSGAWSRFLIGNSRCWAVQDTTLYMGGSATVDNAWTTDADIGDTIPFTLLPAFSFFGASTQLKKYNLSRWLLQADSPPRVRAQFLGDFNLNYVPQPVTGVTAISGLWDTADWDVVVWDGQSTYSRAWYALPGLAYSATQVLYGTSSKGLLRFVSVDYVYETGGLL